MLVVTIELWPYGDHTQRQVIGVMDVANITGEKANKCRYAYDIRGKTEGGSPKPPLVGEIEEFERSRGAFALLAEIFRKEKKL